MESIGQPGASGQPSSKPAEPSIESTDIYSGVFDEWDVVNDTAVETPVTMTGSVFVLENDDEVIAVYESDKEGYRVQHLEYNSRKFMDYDVKDDSCWAGSREGALEAVAKILVDPEQ